MLTIPQLNQFLAEAKAEIPSIKKTELVADDSELVAFLKDATIDDNHMLIAVIPSFGIAGTEEQLKWNNQLMFFVLAQASSRDLTKSQRNDLIGEVQESARALVYFMLGKKTGENGDFCGMMNEVVENSIVVDVVWEKAQCHGWLIQIDLLNRL